MDIKEKEKTDQHTQEEKEDLGLAVLMHKAQRDDKVSRSRVMDILEN